MAFGAHNLNVGDPSKKSAFDQLQENEERNRDRINGDDAFGHGETGHDHTAGGGGVQIPAGGLANGAVDATARLADNVVANAKLKTATQEVSTGAPANLLLASTGCFGFYPCIKKTGGGNITVNIANVYAVGAAYVNVIYITQLGAGTGFAEVTYVQASRDEPVFWIIRDKATGTIISTVFDPECNGETHPFADYLESGIPVDKEVIVLELKRSRELCEHIYKNHGYFRGFTEQILLGLATGVIELGEDTEPLTDVIIHLLNSIFALVGFNTTYEGAVLATQFYTPCFDKVDSDFVIKDFIFKQ